MFSSLYAEVLKSARRMSEWVIQFVLVWLILILISEQGEEHSDNGIKTLKHNKAGHKF